MPSWRRIPISTSGRPGQPARLKVRDGALALGSLGCPGFAVGVDLDFAALRAMPAAPSERLVPAHPGGKT